MEAMRSALCRLMIRSYPRPWRRRYESELMGLAADASMRWRDAADLGRSCVEEWERECARGRGKSLKAFAAA